MSTPVGIEGRFGADCVGTASADHVESISSSYFLAAAPKKLRGDVYANEIERVQLDEPDNLAASVCVCVCHGPLPFKMAAQTNNIGHGLKNKSGHAVCCAGQPNSTILRERKELAPILGPYNSFCLPAGISFFFSFSPVSVWTLLHF